MSSPREKVEALSDTMLAGSEETFEYVCQPCSSENLHVEAVYYCNNCVEFLCDNCCKVHRKLTVSRHHTILDKSAMEKTKPQVKPTDVLTETCPKHAGKLLEFFCNDHKRLCCSVCLTLDHSACSSKSYVPDISDGFAKSQDYQIVLTELDRLVSKGRTQQDRFDDYKKDNDTLRTKALSNIKEFRRQINEFFDKLEAPTEKKIASLHAENFAKISHWSSEVKKIIAKLNIMKSDLKRTENEKKTNQLLVSTELSRENLAILNTTFESSEIKIARYYFHRQENLFQTEAMLTTLWSLSVGEGDTPTKARHVREFSVKSGDDSVDCLITGIVVLSGDRVVVTDNSNNAVKLIDTKLNKITSRLSVSSNPCDVIEIAPDKLAVTLGIAGKIEIISVAKGLCITNTLETPGATYSGFCYDGTNFITVSALQRNFKIIDMTGRILSTFSTDNHGQQLFSKPYHVALGRKKDVVYVTDSEADKVTCMTTGGQVIWIYTHDSLKSPFGIAVGREGSVYVCSRKTHNVHQLSPTGGLTRIMLSNKLEMVMEPIALSYDVKGDMLYISNMNVAQENTNFIHLYQLE